MKLEGLGILRGSGTYEKEGVGVDDNPEIVPAPVSQ